MKTDIYIKFILTVIAILLGTLVFKDSSFTISLPVGLWNLFAFLLVIFILHFIAYSFSHYEIVDKLRKEGSEEYYLIHSLFDIKYSRLLKKAWTLKVFYVLIILPLVLSFFKIIHFNYFVFVANFFTSLVNLSLASWIYLFPFINLSLLYCLVTNKIKLKEIPSRFFITLIIAHVVFYYFYFSTRFSAETFSLLDIDQQFFFAIAIIVFDTIHTVFLHWVDLVDYGLFEPFYIENFPYLQNCSQRGDLEGTFRCIKGLFKTYF
jgi:hypothetical protein